MLFAVYCVDKPGRQDLRLANRAAHLEYLKAAADKIVIGGPMLSDDGTAMIGSMLVLDMADRAAVEAFMADEPYGKAGLFEAVKVRAYKKVFG